MLRPIAHGKKKRLTFFGSDNSYSDKINYYVSRINKSVRTKEWHKAEEYLQKLTTLHDRIFKNAKANPYEVDWFQQNPLYRVKQYIQRAKSLNKVSSNSKLPEIYKNFSSKNALEQSLETFLSSMNNPVDFMVSNIGGANNQVVKVKLDNDSYFICRYFKVVKDEKQNNCSSIDAVGRLADVDAVVQPDKLIMVEDCEYGDDEQVFIEFSEYFNRGNLEEHFKKLHEERRERSYIQQQCLDYTSQILEFYQGISKHNVWYTDMKPSNLLLNQDDRIKISDAKGFVLSDNNRTKINRCGVSTNYHDSSCYIEDRDLDLWLTQQKTLAATIYQLVTDEVPEFKGDTFDWSLEFNFDKYMFSNQRGEQLKEFITELYEARFDSVEDIINRLNEIDQAHLAASSSQSSLN